MIKKPPRRIKYPIEAFISASYGDPLACPPPTIIGAGIVILIDQIIYYAVQIQKERKIRNMFQLKCAKREKKMVGVEL